MPVTQADIVAAVRAATLAPSDYSDDDLMEIMEGTFQLTRIKLRLALSDLRDEVWRAIRNTFARRKR
ncbi:hypothetical protein LCGC14_2579370 [marine sediment metagenome]|uniref:Uncharacterized protein n=1 Tax=marine sediment metagenome TaxID=412755 RepID=A0A0F9B2Q4_9ZZZZ